MKRAILIGLLAVGTHMVHGFQLLPMSLRLAPAGQGATGVFRVVNNTDAPVAVQVSVTTREMDESGEESNLEAGALFQIFPAQMIVPPRAQQTVRVRYVGPTDLTTERAFRLVAEQLPITLDRAGAPAPTVQFVLRYRATLYVAPPGVAANIQARILSATANQVELEVRNSGARHQLLDGTVHFVQGDRELTLPIAELPSMNGQNVLAGGIRHFSIQRNLPFVPDAVTLRLR